MYIIQNVMTLGYWDASYTAFRGPIYATKYKSQGEAIATAEGLEALCTVLQVY